MFHATSRAARQLAAAAFVTLLLLTPVPAAFARETGFPIEPTATSSIQAQIGAPADGSSYRRDVVVEFTDASTSTASCPITSWRWTFGDGSNSTQQNPTHAYSGLGDFVVALQVRSSSCTNQISTTSITLHVVNVLPNASVAGPASGAAGDALTYTATASDEDGTIVSYELLVDGEVVLAQASPDLTHTFTVAGAHQIAAAAIDNDGGRTVATGPMLDIAPGPLAAIAIVGPDPVVAGSTHTLDLQGQDAHGNVVALATESLEHTFQTDVGVEEVCHTESNFTGCESFDVVADGLYEIVLTGPASLTVNTTATYAIEGKDAYGNTVPTENATLDYQAPTLSGVYALCYSEGSVEGCVNVTALADEAVAIEIEGPASVAAGTSTNYTLTGFDQFGNVALLSASVVVFDAPTTPGTYEVCHTEPSNVSACILVQVFSGSLVSIVVTGVDEMLVEETRAFNASGFDEFGNPVALAVTEFNFTAGTVAGVAPVCYSEGGVQGCKNVTIMAGPLAAIQVTGADSQVVNTTASYVPRGFDAHGNNVTLENASIEHRTATTTGTEDVCHTERNVTGCKTILVIADALFVINVTGVDTMVVGTTATFHADGADRYGNDVPLENATFGFTAPTTAGTVQVCTTEQNVTGCKDVQVVADALFEIVLTGPASLVAGSNATYAVSGQDQHGNAVPTEADHVNFTAPRSVGTAQVCHSEQNVSGCKTIDVTVDALASILVIGPETVDAGSVTTFYFAGFDQYGNAVDLDTIAIAYEAPTSVGSADVCLTEDGVTGCKSIRVVAGAPVNITVTGPATMVVNSTATFVVDGADAHGNRGATAVTSLSYTAPATLGPQSVCYTENGVTGCAAVEIVPSPLRRIAVSGPTNVAAGATANYTLVGFDAQDRLVPLSRANVSFTAPRALGEHQVCYTEHGITGCKAVSVVPATIKVALSATQINLGRPVQASAVAFDVDGGLLPASFTWSATRGTVDANGTFLGVLAGNAAITARVGNATGSANVTLTARLLLAIDVVKENTYGEPVNGTVTVTYIDGTPVANASITVSLTNQLLAAAGQTGRTTMSGSTDANGRFGFEAPTLWRLPGNYRVDASASRSGNTGVASTTYAVS